jgi:hypothetical protein
VVEVSRVRVLDAEPREDIIGDVGSFLLRLIEGGECFDQILFGTVNGSLISIVRTVFENFGQIHLCNPCNALKNNDLIF